MPSRRAQDDTDLDAAASEEDAMAQAISQLSDRAGLQVLNLLDCKS